MTKHPFIIHRGDCLEILRDMPDNSVDSVVTDPPYGLSDHKPCDVEVTGYGGGIGSGESAYLFEAA